MGRPGVAAAQGRATSHATPGTQPQPAESPVDVVTRASAALQAADRRYVEEVAHAKTLCTTRLDAAEHSHDGADWRTAIENARKVLAGDTADPAVGVHHVESSHWPPNPLEPSDVMSTDILAVVISYRADVEAARRRWVNAAAAVRQRDLSTLAQEFARAQAQDDSRAKALQPFLQRLGAAGQESVTTWYREPPHADPSGKSAMRSVPVAMEIRDVQIGRATVGEQFRGAFHIRTLVAPYKVDIVGPSYMLLLYDGDQILHFAGGSWNGGHEVTSTLRQNWDTHSNTLAAAGGEPFVFARAGTYTMRLVLTNGGAWNDVLDVYDAPFQVPPAQPPAPATRGRPPQHR